MFTKIESCFEVVDLRFHTFVDIAYLKTNSITFFISLSMIPNHINDLMTNLM